MNRRLLAFVVLAMAGGTLAAAELEVAAPVVDVQPIRETPRQIERCPEQPGAEASLGALLAWNLGMLCTRERVEPAAVTGYRVFYRWDDRVYSRIMPAPPGETIPLTVRLD